MHLFIRKSFAQNTGIQNKRIQKTAARLALSCLVLGLFFAAAQVQAASSNINSNIKIGTGGVSGVYYPAGGALCRLFNRDASQNLGRKCQVVNSAGSAENVALMHERAVSFAIVQSDVQYKAYHGEGPFKNQSHPSLRAVFSLHTEAFTLVVREDKNIESFAHLHGKRLNVGEVGSGQRSTLEELLSFQGQSLKIYSQAVALPAAQMAPALCNDEIDGMVYLVGHPSSAIKEATSSCKSKILGFDESFMQRLIGKFPYFRQASIPGGEYNNNPEDISTFGVAATLVAHVDTPEEEVYALVKAVFENFDAFKRLHPAFTDLKKEEMLSAGLSAPLHSGARRYYREVGLIK